MSSTPTDMVVFNAGVVAEYRANAGRLTTPPLAGARLLLLGTVGAKTGQPRTTPLGYAEDGPGRWILFASNRGAPHHPAWYHNLVARPDAVTIELGAEHIPVAVTITSGAAREHAYATWLARAPDTADHQAQAGREIPMVVVERPAIVDATSADAGEVVTLQRAAFLRDAQIYRDPFMPSLTQTADDIRGEIADPDVVFLLARLGPRLVASVRARKYEDRWYVWRLMTAPDLEGRGLGRMLMDALERRAAASVATFELSTGSESSSNIAWYERLGYRIVAEHEESPTLSVVTMRKPMRPGG